MSTQHYYKVTLWGDEGRWLGSEKFSDLKEARWYARYEGRRRPDVLSATIRTPMGHPQIIRFKGTT